MGVGKMKKAITIPIITLFIAAVIFGCVTSPFQKSEPYDLVPSTATSIAILSPAALLSDPDFAYFYAKANHNKTIESEFAPLERVTGLQMRNVTGAVLFTMGTGSGRKTTAFLKGGFDSTGLEQRFRSDASWSGTDYNGYTVFKKTGEPNAVTFIDDITVVGEPSAVQAAIDVKKGNLQNVRENVQLSGVLSKLNESADAVVATTSLGDMPSVLSGAPLNASFLSGVQASGAHISKRAHDFDVKAVLLTGSPSDANRIQGSLNTMMGFASLLFAQPGSSLASIVSKTSIGTDGEYVVITLTTNVDELKAAEAELDSH